ncbi:MAG: SDR family NAD(P)-dependent oxidoreductase [Pseudomonadota bacterium]
MQRIVIFGATSDIAEATARDFAKAGASFILVGRNALALDDLCADLKVRGAASAESRIADLSDVGALPALCKDVHNAMGIVDVALIAHGVLPDQQATNDLSMETLDLLQVNAVSPSLLMIEMLRLFRAQGHGSLVILSSVAGDRGRPSNYFYGATKALLSTLGEGMALQSTGTNVRVLVVKPGFVDTKMTAAFKKGALWASASDVGGAIVKAVAQGKNGVLYTPHFWQLIMFVVKNAPSFVVRRM